MSGGCNWEFPYGREDRHEGCTGAGKDFLCFKRHAITITITHGGAFGLGEPNVNFAQYFTGNSYLNPLTNPKETVFVANVTFEPGCRKLDYVA